MTALSIERIIELFDSWGLDHYDENISQLDHALQCAALAREAGASDALVLAALLHDIGHLLDLAGGGSVDHPTAAAHEQTGAAALDALLPTAVTAPIALHVRAKRYLTAIEPGYVDGLSDGSRRSLIRQGGPMTANEIREFEAEPHFVEACTLRRWDDSGKVDGLECGSFADHLRSLQAISRTHDPGS